MCHFITLVLPAQGDIEPLREVVERHCLVLNPTSDRLVCRELGSNERAYLTTSMCNCGTQLVNRRFARREHDEDKELVRLRRMGWSETKIQRWRDQRGTAAAMKAEAKAKSREGEVEKWRALLADLLDAKADHVGLVVHWAADAVQRGPVLPRTSLTAITMSQLAENVLYTFTRQPCRSPPDPGR
jgi:hypothetical protein